MKLAAQLVQEVSTTLAPEFAPLPRPFIVHLLSQDSRYMVLPSHIKKTMPEDRYLEQIWQRFVVARSVIYSYLYPYVMAEWMQHGQRFPTKQENKAHGDGDQNAPDERLTTGWLLKRLEACFPQGEREAEDPEERESQDEVEAYTPSMQMISDWHQRGLLRYSEWGMPKASSAAAILIMRSMLKKTRSLLPSSMDRDEPDFWVWGLLPGGTPTQYALPLASALPPHTFLWSPYPLAALEGSWTMFHKRGAVRWAGTCVVEGRLLWNVTEEGLQAWSAAASIPVCFHRIDQLAELEDLPILTPGEQLAHKRLSLHPTADDLLTRIGLSLLTGHLKRFYAKESLPLGQILSSRKWAVQL